MNAPDVRVCARCGQPIRPGFAVKRHPPVGAFDAEEWFCDWTCEGHYTSGVTTPNRHPRKAQP